jgi:hypothetical protein
VSEAKVVGLHGQTVYAGEPNPDAVEELEAWLERARAGDVVGVAIAAHYRDGATGSRWGGVLSRSLVGQCFSLAHRITEKLESS